MYTYVYICMYIFITVFHTKNFFVTEITSQRTELIGEFYIFLTSHGEAIKKKIIFKTGYKATGVFVFTSYGYGYFYNYVLKKKIYIYINE